MPRGPGYPAEVRNAAVSEYLAGRATMPVIARELGVTTATISRWVKEARGRGTVRADQPDPSNPALLPTQAGDLPISPTPSLASRVAALAPPPAPPEAPALDLGDGSAATVIAALAAEYRAHLETAKRAKAQNDPKAETAARSAAVKLAIEIRQQRKALLEEGGEALALTRDDIENAMAWVRDRLDELAAARGEKLMWTLDGTPDLRPPTPTGDASHVTRDTSTPGPRRP